MRFIGFGDVTLTPLLEYPSPNRERRYRKRGQIYFSEGLGLQLNKSVPFFNIPALNLPMPDMESRCYTADSPANVWT